MQYAKDWGLGLLIQLYRVGIALLVLLGLTACSKGQERVEVSLPRLDVSPEVAVRRSALCTPERLSLRSALREVCSIPKSFVPFLTVPMQMESFVALRLWFTALLRPDFSRRLWTV